jgi:hypothetical protein
LQTARILRPVTRRRLAAATALTVALAALATAPTGAGAATTMTTSSNWAGYAVSRTGVRFRRVAATWVAPTATCTPGRRRRYSAAWLGLGGYHATSTALEQIGTEADCTSRGSPVYSAWYELVPAAPTAIHLKVSPGDTISASVSVANGVVRLYFSNRTRGTVFTKQLRADHLDTTSAEWIVEAPSACDGYRCETLPLADFGTTTFANAKATTATGHGGAIADPAWASTAIALGADGHPFRRSRQAAGDGAAAADPGDLSPTGDAFTVSYREPTGTPPGPPPVA